MKLYKSEVGELSSEKRGKCAIKKAGLTVVCGDGRVLLLSLIQVEGKQPMPGEVFVRGLQDQSVSLIR